MCIKWLSTRFNSQLLVQVRYGTIKLGLVEVSKPKLQTVFFGEFLCRKRRSVTNFRITDRFFFKLNLLGLLEEQKHVSMKAAVFGRTWTDIGREHLPFWDVRSRNIYHLQTKEYFNRGFQFVERPVPTSQCLNSLRIGFALLGASGSVKIKV